MSKDIKKEFNDMVKKCREERGMNYRDALLYVMEYHLDLHERYLAAENPHMTVDHKKIADWRERIERVKEIR